MAKRSLRIITAVSLAIEQNRQLFDDSKGLRDLVIEVKLDADGCPERVIIMPSLSCFIRSKPVDSFTFETT